MSLWKVKRELHRAGDRLRRRLRRWVHRIRGPTDNPTLQPHARLHVGCGEERIPGYVGCDIRSVPGVSVVCAAWEVSRYASDVAEIYSRHMLEHLALGEVEATLGDWHDALGEGGHVHLIVPFLDYHLRQWLDAEWNDETFGRKMSKARHGLAGIYGWQRECDPSLRGYSPSYWDLHKSGYNRMALPLTW